MKPREVNYAKSGVHSLAYTVSGEGPVDLIYLLGFVSHLDLLWEEPQAASFLHRLEAFSRLIVMDKRGTGLSDRAGDIAIPEEQVADLLAVMDAVGAERPALFGTQDGFLISALLAGTRPERVGALISFAAGATTPEDWPNEELERFLVGLEKYWGREDAPFNYWAPTAWREDAAFRRWWARYSRAAAGPATAVRVCRNYTAANIRPLLPAIQAPTLVIDVVGRDPIGGGRPGTTYLADQIVGSRYVKVEGDSGFPWLGPSDEVADLIEEFLTGARPATPTDRVLATMLFTDVVDSTGRAVKIGDKRWAKMLDRHDAILGSEVERFRGRLVKHTGDGALALFDGPARAVQCALALREHLGELDLVIRSGIHTGEVELRGEDVGGLGVHIASRVMGESKPLEVLVSRTVVDLVAGSGLEFQDRGERELKGVPGRWNLYSLRA